jgi:hypothetical protein
VFSAVAQVLERKQIPRASIAIKTHVVREHLLIWLKSIGSLPPGWLTKEMKRRVIIKSETDFVLTAMENKVPSLTGQD